MANIKKPKNPPWDTKDPRGMGALVMDYFEYTRTRGFSEETIRTDNNALRHFAVWMEARGLKQPREVTRPIIERYQRYLLHYRKENGEPMSVRGIHGRITPLKSFFRWLTKSNIILSNPVADIELPRLGKRLPQKVLSKAEAENILALPDIKTPLGLRDRAILETLYSTGVRRMELINLKTYQVDKERGTIMIREGKGRKDRLIPIGDRALAWIDKYLRDTRPSLAVEPDDATLFLTKEGKRLELSTLTRIVSDYARRTGIKNGACHMFRHTMATLMLEGGADIRFIQQMLGHSKLDTTEKYTQVSVRKLQEVYLATHPGASLKKSEPRNEKEDGEPITEEKLFSSLAAEEEEEETGS